ncbi:MAG: FAD-dependent pyridine nucleotide-disulfide oxidoreductase [Polaromonas sp.]|nr:FAD-dependent pyridine nucleotide-disulfide oxidoreductase [Polaromonas sp.]
MTPEIPALQSGQVTQGQVNQKAPIVVVGGGAAGLELVTRLAEGHIGKREGVVLVDRALGHIWKPRLHEIATAMLSQASAQSSFWGHAKKHGYRFEIGALRSIDLPGKTVVLDDLVGADGSVVLHSRRIAYSQLVLALGSEENDFGTAGAREHCHFLNNPDQAANIRDALLAGAFRLARGEQARMSIVIIGGGATGVELAAEIRHTLDKLWEHEPGLDRSRVRLTVIEAAERLLSANPLEVSQYAANSLRQRDVDVLVGQRVQSVDAAGVQLASGSRVDADLKVWTAGIRGPHLFDEMPYLPHTRSGRVQVDGVMRCDGLQDVYAIGDCAEWTDPTSNRPSPYTAQIASAQARYLADAMQAWSAGRQVEPFRFQSAGAIVSLGDRGAAGNLTTRFGRRSRETFIQGFSAKLVYELLYRQHELAIHGWRGTVARILTDWLSRAYEPAIKLH